MGRERIKKKGEKEPREVRREKEEELVGVLHDTHLERRALGVVVLAL